MTLDDLVTKEVYCFIENLLKDLEISKYEINISQGSIRGDNYLGIIAKVQIKGINKQNEEVTLNLITKSAPRGEGFRSMAPIREAYDREIYIYSRVFPEFNKLQKERGLLKPFKSFAKYYSSTMSDSNEALIMEDMKELGYKLKDRHDPLDFNHLLLVMKEYGKLHALSYAMRDQKPELFQKLSDDTQESFFCNMQSDVMNKSVDQQCEKALKSLDPVKHKVAYEKFKNFQNKMVDLIKDILKSESAGQYGVITHGDCWVNNMLFKYGNTTKLNIPTEVCLLDWQLSRLGSPALDLSYFLFTCSDKNVRDEHYDQLIQEYYDSLSSMLHKLGSDPDKLFPFDVLQKHLKIFSVFGLYMAVMVLFIMTSEVEEIPDIHSMTNEEDVLDKFQYESKNVERYYERIRGVILDFVKFDYEF